MIRPRVLIVEDDLALEGDVLQGILERNGYEVVATAANAKEAVDMAEATRPDLVMMDIGIPLRAGEAPDVTGGIKAARQIRARAHPALVFVTARPAPDELMQEVYRIAPDAHFLIKPPLEKQTIAMVRLALVRTFGKKRVFVCYARKDEEFRNEMAQFLQGMTELGVDTWDDRKILFGEHWADEIAKAVHSADVAILLVSIHFINSRFIKEFELPSLLVAEQQRGLKIVPVFVRFVPQVMLISNRISAYQGINAPDDPLDCTQIWTPEKRAADAWGPLCQWLARDA
jgi:CheY-like chemotaxis protein